MGAGAPEIFGMLEKVACLKIFLGKDTEFGNLPLWRQS